MEALEAHLRAKGVRVGVLGNAYANAARARALDAVGSGKAQVLLSTEMAARGLDIPRLSHVVNFDPPGSLREYVHRAGRVGRLGSARATGTVITFAGSDDEAAALLDMAGELGVALGELTLAGGDAAVTPLLEAAGDLDEHRAAMLRRATKVRIAAPAPAPAAAARAPAPAPAARAPAPAAAAAVGAQA